jgi:hypothetical protein
MKKKRDLNADPDINSGPATLILTDFFLVYKRKEKCLVYVVSALRIRDVYPGS